MEANYSYSRRNTARRNTANVRRNTANVRRNTANVRRNTATAVRQAAYHAPGVCEQDDTIFLDKLQRFAWDNNFYEGLAQIGKCHSGRLVAAAGMSYYRDIALDKRHRDQIAALKDLEGKYVRLHKLIINRPLNDQFSRKDMRSIRIDVARDPPTRPFYYRIMMNGKEIL